MHGSSVGGKAKPLVWPSWVADALKFLERDIAALAGGERQWLDPANRRVLRQPDLGQRRRLLDAAGAFALYP